MGYTLHSFIGKQSDLTPITSKFSKAKMITLEQDIGIIPMTEELYDEINNFRVL